MIEASTVDFIPGSVPGGVGTDTDGDGDIDQVVVPGEGTWTVDDAGNVTFVPEAGFGGDPSPLDYTVMDDDGLSTNVATITITYLDPPIAVDDEDLDNDAGTSVTLPITGNDSDPDGVIDATTVDFIPGSVPGGVGSDTDGDGDIDEVVVPGEGTWTVDDGGNVTFTPEAGFLDDPSPIDYTVMDDDGLSSNPATVTITYLEALPPVAVDDEDLNNDAGTSVTLPITGNDSDPDGVIDASTVDFIPGSVPGGVGTDTDGDGDIDEVVVPGEGTWTVDVDGNTTFVPEAGFDTNPTPIDYTVMDDDGLTTNVATVTITYLYPPVAVDDEDLDNDAGTTVTLPITGNDSDPDGTVEPDTVNFDATSVPGGIGADTDGDGDIDQVVVPGEGTWTVDDAGNVTFTPEAGFLSNPTPIDYTVDDNDGLTSNVATVTITYLDALNPTAVDDEDLDNQPGSTVTLPITGNDSDPDGVIEASTVDFIPGSVPGGVGTDTDGDGDIDQVVVPGEGTWTVDDAGNVTFVPEAGFGGDPSPLDYTVNDDDGQTSNVATITITYLDPPVAVDDSSVGNDAGTSVTLPITGNDSDPDGVIDATTVDFIPGSVPGGVGTDTDGDGDIDQVVVPGEGTWTVDDGGNVTFTPEAGFLDDPSPIDYTVMDDDGLSSNPATITVSYVDALPPVAVDDEDLDNQPGSTVTLPITGNDSDPDGVIEASTVDFIPGSVPGGVGTDTDGDGDIDQVVVPGEGTWTVDDAGNVTFVPEAGFGGDPSPLDYTVMDDDGLSTNVATITITYLDPPIAVDDEDLDNDAGTSVTLPITGNDSDPDGVIDATTVDFIPGSVPGGVGTDTDGDGDIDQVVVPGEGTWTVDDGGNVTFTPEAGFLDDPSPIDYTVMDDDGLSSNPATITVSYVDALPPVAVDDEDLDNQPGSTVTYR